MFPEPHSTKQIEDCVAWGLDTTPETLILTMQGGDSGLADEAAAEALCRSDRAAPSSSSTARDDAIMPLERGRARRRADRRRAGPLRGLGPRAPSARPGARQPAAARLRRARRGRPPAAGAHLDAQPRAAAARAVRLARRSGSATRGATSRSPTSCAGRCPGSRSSGSRRSRSRPCCAQRGETIHPASAELASEAAHIDREAGEHDLHAFQAIRRMDEILCANFMVFARPRARGAVRRLDRRRGLGGRPLPAREPRAEDGAVRVADRLRRLPADARRAASARRS